jgi:hypothetical protein
MVWFENVFTISFKPKGKRIWKIKQNHRSTRALFSLAFFSFRSSPIMLTQPRPAYPFTALPFPSSCLPLSHERSVTRIHLRGAPPPTCSPPLKPLRRRIPQTLAHLPPNPPPATFPSSFLLLCKLLGATAPSPAMAPSWFT